MNEREFRLKLIGEVRLMKKDLSDQMKGLAQSIGQDVGRLAQRVDALEMKLHPPPKRRLTAVKR